MSDLHPGCEYVDWHESDECLFDDLRHLGTQTVIVDGHYQAVPIEVKHGVHAYFAKNSPRYLLAAEFRAQPIIHHDGGFHQNVNDNIDLHGPSNE